MSVKLPAKPLEVGSRKKGDGGTRPCERSNFDGVPRESTLYEVQTDSRSCEDRVYDVLDDDPGVLRLHR